MLKIEKFGARYYTNWAPTSNDCKNFDMQLQKSVEQNIKRSREKLMETISKRNM